MVSNEKIRTNKVLTYVLISDAKKDQSSSLNESSVSGEDSLIHNSSCECNFI